MKLTQISKTFGDCTAIYSVELEKPYTVGELIEEILKRKEWGYIGIDDKGDTIFGNPHYEYKDKEIIGAKLPIEILNKQIKNVKARGGWSNMDYVIEIKT